MCESTAANKIVLRRWEMPVMYLHAACLQRKERCLLTRLTGWT